MKRIGIKVAGVLHAFIEQEALTGTGVAPDAFWNGLAGLVRDLAPRNRDLLDLRDHLQSRIDEYHRANAGKPFDAPGYERFLREIGYLRPEPDDFSIRTENVRRRDRSHRRTAARGAGVERALCVTYIPIGRGFLYVVAIIDWAAGCCGTSSTRRGSTSAAGMSRP